MPVLTLERLQEVLDYNPDTGLLTWKIATGKKTQLIGKPAGHLNKRWGYIEARIDGRSYRAHRLAWMLMTGQPWPKEIDHINCDPSDNRWCNLRQATRSGNNANRKGYSKSGFKGAYKIKNGWMARITVGNKLRYLGFYKTPEEAQAAYWKAAQEHYGAFARI